MLGATNAMAWKAGTHPLGCLGPEPVFPCRCVSGVAGVLRGIAVLDEAQQSTRLVGFEGREVGADEDGLLLEGGTQTGIVRRARASSQGEEEGDGVVQTTGGIVVHCARRGLESVLSCRSQPRVSTSTPPMFQAPSSKLLLLLSRPRPWSALYIAVL